MPQTDTSSYSAALKIVFGPKLIEELVTTCPLVTRFEKADMMTWEGRDTIEYPLHVGRNQGFAYGRERGPIAVAGAEEYVSFKVPHDRLGPLEHQRQGHEGVAVEQGRLEAGAHDLLRRPRWLSPALPWEQDNPHRGYLQEGLLRDVQEDYEN